MFQHAQTLLEVGTAVAHERRQILDGLDVVRVHVESRLCHAFDVGEVAAKVAREAFHEDLRASVEVEAERSNVHVSCCTHITLASSYFSFNSSTVRAKCSAPPSSRSSRSTLVSTT